MPSEPQEKEIKMDPAALWREEVFTDRKAGTIRRLSPVRSDGTPDMSRKPVFVGEAQILTPMGSLPLSFEIVASNLDDAVVKYGEAVQAAVAEAMEELKELRRRSSSGLVIPQAGGGMGPGGMGPGILGPGGLPGGSKLKLL